MSASRQTPAQLADAAARARDGRPDKTVMSNQERLAAGLMDRGQAAEHERLVTLPHERLAERVRGPVDGDAGFCPGCGGPVWFYSSPGKGHDTWIHEDGQENCDAT
jgi:hypothetical protein